MAYGQYRLQFLHISDLHAKGPREPEPWRRRRVLGDAWQRNLETMLAEEGRIDLVFFTGDAAQSGKPEEYAEVTDFLGALSGELDIGLDRLFVVPGNHDIDRDAEKSAWESMRMRLAVSTDLLGVSRWMNGISPRPPLGFEDSWKSAILERQSGYRAWVKDSLRRADLVPDGPRLSRIACSFPAGRCRSTSWASTPRGSAATMRMPDACSSPRTSWADTCPTAAATRFPACASS